MMTERDVLQELEAALDVSPSPDFEARVRERITQQSFAMPRWAWTAGLAAAATIVLAVMLVPERPEEVVPVTPQPVANLPVARPEAAAAAPAPAARHAARRPTGARTESSSTVIVPAGQAAAIQRLAAALAAGRVAMAPPRPHGLDELEIAAVAPPDPLVFKAIEIRALAPDAAPDLWR